MKLKSLSLLLFLSCFIFSCDAVDNLFSFNVDNEVSFTIPKNFPVNIPIGMSSPDITTNSSEEFSNNNTKANLVKDVRLKELKITITAPADKTFSFLKSVHLYISTNDSNEIELAYLDNIDVTTNTINLIPTSEKLDNYIKESTYKIRTVVVTKEALTSDVSVKSNMSFRVTADPF